MSTFKFKTNINCGSCVRAVTPMLNKLSTLENWEVDTDSEEKVLITSGENLLPEDVIKALSKVGFQAALMN